MVEQVKSRRRLLAAGVGVAAVAASAVFVMRKPLIRLGFVAAVDNEKFAVNQSLVDNEGACTVTGQAMEGPFYLPASPLRRDIREGQVGQLLNLKLKFVDASTCQPLVGTSIHIWHANAKGFYSGYTSHNPDQIELTPGHEPVENNEQFLRGQQITDATGQVEFTTICPAWYSFRTPHIHLKVVLSPSTEVTMQLYFPEEINTLVREKVEPYRMRPEPLVDNRRDPIIRASKGAPGGWLKMTSGQGAYSGTLTISVMPAVLKKSNNLV